MVDEGREITRKTFLKHVDKTDMREVEKDLGYRTQHGYGHGLTMASDWAVRYFKSKFNGKPCVYFQWSAIEHIFI